MLSNNIKSSRGSNNNSSSDNINSSCRVKNLSTDLNFFRKISTVKLKLTKLVRQIILIYERTWLKNKRERKRTITNLAKTKIIKGF